MEIFSGWLSLQFPIYVADGLNDILIEPSPKTNEFRFEDTEKLINFPGTFTHVVVTFSY